MNRRHLLTAATAAAAALALPRPGLAAGSFPFTLTEAQWRARLTPDQFRILREDATEVPGTSPLLNEKRPGRFACSGCGQPVFASDTKYDSQTGWPSFWAAIPGAVAEAEDRTAGMIRTSVQCANCGGHLGHVFPDGPKPTGLRYCINGLVLAFKPAAA